MEKKPQRKTVRFKAESVEDLPADKPVVYRILNSNDQNIYTGVAKRGRVRERIKEHLPGAQDAVPGGLKVRIQQQSSIDEAKKSEQRIIARSKPRHNKKGK